MDAFDPEHRRLTLVVAACNEAEALPSLHPRLLAALDMALLLKIGKWPAGTTRAGWAVVATAGVIAAANFLIVAGQVGQNFGIRPWVSALQIGPHYAWLLATLATARGDLALYAVGLLLAAWLGLSGRRPAPSAR